MIRSHGDGRRMTLAEARERRARIVRVHGSLRSACLFNLLGQNGQRRMHRDDRRWAFVICNGCVRPHCHETDAVCLLDGIPVAMCSACRATRSAGSETLDEVTGQFLANVEEIIGDEP